MNLQADPKPVADLIEKHRVAAKAATGLANIILRDATTDLGEVFDSEPPEQVAAEAYAAALTAYMSAAATIFAALLRARDDAK